MKSFQLKPASPFVKAALPMAVATLLTGNADNAIAQEVKKAKGKSSVFLEEVIVTSRKRSVTENAQDVPAAMSVFTGEMLDAAFVQDVMDVGRFTPNVQLSAGGSVPGQPSYYIRGQGSNSSIPSDDAPVATIVDGITYGVSNGALVDLFDAESIEVLRGPQGTLLGKNATAGAVVIRTARAGFDPLAEVKASYGTGSTVGISGRVGGGIIDDTLAGKLSVFYRDTDGLYDNQVLNEDYGEEETKVIRPYFRLTPTDNLTIDLMFEDGNVEGDGTVPHTLATLPNKEPDEVYANIPGENEIEWTQGVVEVNYETEDGVLTSVSGYREAEQIQRLDSDASGTDIFIFGSSVDQEQFSQELRWAGTPFENKDIDITIGAYYFDQEFEYVESRDLFGFRDLDGDPTTSSLHLGLGGNVEHDFWAVFARGNWKIDDVVFNFGARFNSESKDGEISQGFTCTFDPLPGSGRNDISTASCDLGLDVSDDWTSFMPYVGIQWFPTENAQLYASFKGGFRSGGINVRNSSALAEPLYDEEEVNSFEIGGKFDLFDGRVRMNLATFFNAYEDMQRVVVIPGTTNQTVFNAGEAETYGAEVDLTIGVSDNFTLIASYGYMDGGYNEFLGLTLPPDRTVASIDINRMANNTASATGIYDVYLGDHGGLTFRASWSYRDNRPLDDLNTPAIIAPSTDLFDASVTWTSPSEQLEISAYGKNLTNDFEALAGVAIWPDFTIGSPRRYGLEVQYRFF